MIFANTIISHLHFVTSLAQNYSYSTFYDPNPIFHLSFIQAKFSQQPQRSNLAYIFCKYICYLSCTLREV